MALRDTPSASTDDPEPGEPVLGRKRRPPSPASRTEVRLRIQVAELEEQLAEIAACLQAAEQRAAELLGTRDQMETATAEAERRFAVIAGSRSWQLTKPLRLAMDRLRRPPH
jgi:hypothetical protein